MLSAEDLFERRCSLAVFTRTRLHVTTATTMVGPAEYPSRPENFLLFEFLLFRVAGSRSLDLLSRLLARLVLSFLVRSLVVFDSRFFAWQCPLCSGLRCSASSRLADQRKGCYSTRFSRRIRSVLHHLFHSSSVSSLSLLLLVRSRQSGLVRGIRVRCTHAPDDKDGTMFSLFSLSSAFLSRSHARSLFFSPSLASFSVSLDERRWVRSVVSPTGRLVALFRSR